MSKFISREKRKSVQSHIKRETQECSKSYQERNARVFKVISRQKRESFQSHIKRETQECSKSYQDRNSRVFKVMSRQIRKSVQCHIKTVPTSDLEMDSLTGMINARMASIHEPNNLDCVIGTEQVFNAIRQLKSDKRDGQQDFYSNHIINASGRMHILLTLLINSMVIHGHWPPELLNSTIVSIPKDSRGSLSNSDN